MLIRISCQFGNVLDEVGAGKAEVGIDRQEIQNGLTQDKVALLLCGQLLGGRVLMLQLLHHLLEFFNDFGVGIADSVNGVQESGLVGQLSGVSHSINSFLVFWTVLVLL